MALASELGLPSVIGSVQKQKILHIDCATKSRSNKMKIEVSQRIFNELL